MTEPIRPPLRKYLIWIIVLTVYAGSVTAGAIGYVHVTNCTNDALGKRNKPTQDDADAHIAYAKASRRFDDAMVAVVTAPRGSRKQATAYVRFISAARVKDAADSAYVAVLATNQATRRAHPLGRC